MERNLPRVADSANTVGGHLKPSHLKKKPHPPFNAAGEGRVLHRRRRNFVPEFWLEVGFVVSPPRKCCIIFLVAWTALWLREIWCHEGGDFSRKSHGTSTVSDADGNAGSSYSENLGFGRGKGSIIITVLVILRENIFRTKR